MDWFEIVIKVPVAQCETASAIANMTVPYGIYIEDYSDMETVSWEIAHIDLIDEDLLSKDKNTAFIHIYMDKSDNVEESLAYLKERFSAEKIEFQVELGTVAEIDWTEYWKKFFHTSLIGKRLAVVPAWEEYENKEERKILKIDPGAAFGTGTHATTSLCLEFLEQYTNQNDTLLDIGSGSGILSIAGVILGAKSAIGVDIDQGAVKVAKENAVMNGVADKTEYIHGDLAEQVQGEFDIVCANIVADVIMKLLTTVDKYMKPHGVLIASGIISPRADEVRKCIISNGFKIEQELVREEWHAFAIKK